MGEQKPNLLREVYCERPCRTHFVETTEIEIAKNNGKFLQLDAGKTIVNLVFRKF